MRSLPTLAPVLALITTAAIGATVTSAEAHDDGTRQFGSLLSRQAVATLAGARMSPPPPATPESAVAAGYLPSGACVSGPHGGMGYHYINLEILFTAPFNPMSPPMLVYVPT